MKLMLIMMMVVISIEGAPGGSLVVGGVYKPWLADVKLDYLEQALAAGRLAWKQRAKEDEKSQRRRVSTIDADSAEPYVPAFFTSAENRKALLQANNDYTNFRIPSFREDFRKQNNPSICVNTESIDNFCKD